MVAISDNSLALAGSTTAAPPAVAPARTTTTTANSSQAPAGATRREQRIGLRHRGHRGNDGGARHDENDDRFTGVDDDRRSGGDDPGGHGRDHAEDD